MNDALIDPSGEPYCWNCGNQDFRPRRTLKARALEVIWALVNVVAGLLGAWANFGAATRRKLKCQVCGEYNNCKNKRSGARSGLPVASPQAPTTVALWHVDPTGRHELRYWDGAAWTDHVSDRSITSTDPVSG